MNIREVFFLESRKWGPQNRGPQSMSVSTMRGRYWNSVPAFLLDSLQWRVTWGCVYSLVFEASRQSILNFRIGLLSSIRGDCRTPVCRPHFRFLDFSKVNNKPQRLLGHDRVEQAEGRKRAWGGAIVGQSLPARASLDTMISPSLQTALFRASRFWIVWYRNNCDVLCRPLPAVTFWVFLWVPKPGCFKSGCLQFYA